jgi:catechol 2,3-dioxygenase-like lactoylglutathione lyase family enzyme
MHLLGIEEVIFGSNDIQKCRQFFLDWGLILQSETTQELLFSTLNGCKVVIVHSENPDVAPGVEPDPTLRELIWGVKNNEDLGLVRERLSQQPGYIEVGNRIGCTDPNGLALRVQVTQKNPISVDCARFNTWNERHRIDQPSPSYERATPIEVGHVVFFVTDLAATARFYRDFLGFVVSDEYPGRGCFLRCAPEGGHHNLFLLQLPEPKAGLNHVAFTVRDVHEVFGGGMHMSRCGWDTQLGPGRHPISSAIFWYFVSPAGALVEYYTDEDELTQAWKPRKFNPAPEVFAEWAIDGGIDGHTRRQKNAQMPSGRFMTEKPR